MLFPLGWEKERGPTRLQQLSWCYTPQYAAKSAHPFDADADSISPAKNKRLDLSVLITFWPEFQQGILAAYVQLKMTFDSVYREALGDI